MKTSKVYKIIMMLLMVVPSIASASSVLTLVPGRTWWYSADLWNLDTYQRDYFDYGLRLAEVLDTEGEYYECYVVGPDKKPLFDVALCKLREEGDKVWIVPTMDLATTIQVSESDDLYMRNVAESLSVFLPYWYGNKYVQDFYEGEELEELNYWTKEPPATEYLLYDYGLEVGDKCIWPWTGEDNKELLEFLEPYSTDDSVIVESVAIDNSTGKRLLTTSQQWGSLTGYVDHMTILEGVGVTGGSFHSFIPCYYGYAGLFIGPCSLGSGAIPGMCNPGDPRLRAVMDPDGTCVYGDPDYEKKIAGITTTVASRPADGLLYDLNGRRLEEPIRGQLYVKDGKLQFCK